MPPLTTPTCARSSPSTHASWPGASITGNRSHNTEARSHGASRSPRMFSEARSPVTGKSYAALYGSVLPAVEVAQQGNLRAVMDQLSIDVQDPVLHGKPLGTHR